MADGAMPDLVGRKLGDFVLREQIGEGGHAVVYRCEQQQLGRDVVVKVLHERRRYTDAALDRFQREARLASQLDHPYAAPDATMISDNLVMAGGADSALRLWDLESGRPLWTLWSHASRIIGVHVEGGDIVTRSFTG